MTTELQWYRENAIEHVGIIFDAETGRQSHLAIFNEDQIVFDEIDKSFALAIAARLVELAIELPETRTHLPVTTLAPEKRRKFRRLASVDDELMGRDQ